jgi:G3E family GTPase
LRTLATDEELALLFRLDSIVTVVDCVNGHMQLDNNPESVKQAAVADVLVLSKTDITGADHVNTLGERLKRLNPGARQLAAIRGALDCAALFGRTPHAAGTAGLVEDWLAEAAFRAAEEPHGHAHGSLDVNRHDERVRAFCLRHEPPVSSAGLVAWINLLAGLKGANLLRVKALVNVEGRPVVVHAVQSVIHEPVVLEEWPSSDRSTRVVFIVRDMTRSEVEHTLKLFELNIAKRAPGALIDPQEYARFVQAAAGLRG